MQRQLPLPTSNVATCAHSFAAPCYPAAQEGEDIECKLNCGDTETKLDCELRDDDR